MIKACCFSLSTEGHKYPRIKDGDINHCLPLLLSVKTAHDYSNFNYKILFLVKDNILYRKECLVYPGGYIPLPEVEALVEELLVSGKDIAAKPLINMDEFDDYYKIQAAVPGINREDIFIYVQDRVLTILIFHRESEELKREWQIHEFETDYLERQILLPENADTEFVSAEYRQGLLSMYISKMQEQSMLSPCQIVVY